MNSLAETLTREPLPREPWSAEFVRTLAFAYRNVIMAKRNVFFVFELTFWPGVAMLSHGLLTRFLHLDARMTAFILVGTVALSAVQVCQLDVAYAVLFDIWSKSMKHQFLTPIGIRHMAVGSWLVGVARGVVVFLLMAAIGSWSFGFDFIGGGPGPLALEGGQQHGTHDEQQHQGDEQHAEDGEDGPADGSELAGLVAVEPHGPHAGCGEQDDGQPQREGAAQAQGRLLEGCPLRRLDQAQAHQLPQGAAGSSACRVPRVRSAEPELARAWRIARPHSRCNVRDAARGSQLRRRCYPSTRCPG